MNSQNIIKLNAGNNCWYELKISNIKKILLQKKIKTKDIINLYEFGEIIRSGYH